MEKDVFWPPAKYLAERFGVHITTARRWVRERYAPPAVMMLLSGDLEVFDPEWAGWRVRSGLLRSPEGFECTMSDVRSLPFVRLQISTHRTENVRLRAENEELKQQTYPAMEDQPVPEDWTVQIDYG